jgi:hypothetical protein
MCANVRFQECRTLDELTDKHLVSLTRREIQSLLIAAELFLEDQDLELASAIGALHAILDANPGPIWKESESDWKARTAAGDVTKTG